MGIAIIVAVGAINLGWIGFLGLMSYWAIFGG
ncbi:hypothetical protein C8J33_101915 [Rhizobium sp. PP-CC-3G-465]|nr:hypothetical protein C8J33_101915 [Rhizobium sp. PP-CC-3G-465]